MVCAVGLLNPVRLAAPGGDFYRSAQRKEQHVGVDNVIGLSALPCAEVLSQPVLIALDTGDVSVPVILLANGIDCRRACCVALFIQSESAQHMLVNDRLGTIGQMPTELFEHLGFAMQQWRWLRGLQGALDNLPDLCRSPFFQTIA